MKLESHLSKTESPKVLKFLWYLCSDISKQLEKFEECASSLLHALTLVPELLAHPVWFLE